LLDKGLPPWADNHADVALARLMNKPVSWATKAFNKAHETGYIDKVKP